MRTQIGVGSLILFAPNIGIIVEDVRAAIDNPECLMIALEKAEAHLNNPYLVDACCGGRGPLADAGYMEFEEYLERLAGIERSEKMALAAKAAKKNAMVARRAQFSACRNDLVLQLLDAGVSYICAHPSCAEFTNLAVDHKFPLSRGGTDDLENLQFLCRSCNSSKGNKTMEEWMGST